MGKILVVCIDGTWNAPGQLDSDPIDHTERNVETNVVKTWEALTDKRLDPSRPYGSIGKLLGDEGEALYLNGVGSTGSSALRLFQGATGTGTTERILDAYRFLAERWQRDDRIFGFGFSRGAFAVRSLAGLIDAVGLPVSNNLLKEEDLTALLEIYRYQGQRPVWTEKAKVEFLGVWDTVSAFAGRLFNNYHDISPHNVKNVCHALALDEAREFFRPKLWKNPAAEQTIEQVWFMGAHSNVGGSYIDARLSNIALYWVLNEAADSGLRINLQGHLVWLSEDIQGARRPAYQEFMRNFGPVGDVITRFNLGRMDRAVPEGHMLHASVVEAMTTLNYKPFASVVPNLITEPWGID